MNRTKHLIGMTGFVLCVALPGFITYGQPSATLEVNVGLPSVEIRAQSDFYAPLTPYGQWEVVGSYGRCWRPGHVARDWRPYCSGSWQWTDAGWYWVSDEPWGWATYHYGRWDFTDQYGWYWVPQTQWAPAWVSWHTGGGYIGWAPLYATEVRVISPQAYVFVEERHFLEPVRSSTVVVANTTIIHQTVINQAPATEVIEKASGRKVPLVAVREQRHKDEAVVLAKQKTPATIAENKAATPAPTSVKPGEKNTVVAHVTPQAQKKAAATPRPVALAPKNHETQSQKQKPVPAPAQVKPQTKPEANHPAPMKEPAGQNASQHAEKPTTPLNAPETKAQLDTPPPASPARPAVPPSSP